MCVYVYLQYSTHILSQHQETLYAKRNINYQLATQSSYAESTEVQKTSSPTIQHVYTKPVLFKEFQTRAYPCNIAPLTEN